MDSAWQSLEAGLSHRDSPRCWQARRSPLPTKAFGLTFPNPVGLAAGLDKNGAHIDALLALGFGFVEIGTVTPRAQPGNPKPRMFRLPQHEAVINRLGFNNEGVDALVRNVERAQPQARPARHQHRQEQGHAERIAPSPITCTACERVYPLADYVTVNISSPNTAGLRELQEEQALRRLVGGLREAQERLARAARQARADAGQDRAGPERERHRRRRPRARRSRRWTA